MFVCTNATTLPTIIDIIDKARRISDQKLNKSLNIDHVSDKIIINIAIFGSVLNSSVVGVIEP